LEGQTALVTGGGTFLGRAIALALSARGVRVVVTGKVEKALGVTVGEIVHGGGKARHLAGDVRDAAHLAAAVERALEVFGTLDIVVAAEASDVESAFGTHVTGRMRTPGRLVAAVVDPSGASTKLVHDRALAVASHGITCNAILVAGSAAEDAAEDVAALAVFLCSRAGSRISGQAVALGDDVDRSARGPRQGA
jgi:NAD(P)-dependent dehydrogenase (short-subunit alcohol dehydrogenase family)